MHMNGPIGASLQNSFSHVVACHKSICNKQKNFNDATKCMHDEYFLCNAIFDHIMQ